MAEDRVGQHLGNYRLIRRLGEGGFAEVYQGEHIYLKIGAAIKVLHTRLAADELERFVSEAQTIARLRHPHIVRVLEFGVEGSTPFLVMDYAPGGTLRSRHRKGSVLAPQVLLSYVKQVAEALHSAHDQKLVHRDVKPENMLLGERDEVLLSDFGIATVAQSSRYQGTQEVAGTVAYMAPEQVQGKPRPASDQYALGIIVYEWLTGERPFHGSFTEVATQHLLTPPPPLHEKLPDIAPALEEVVLTTLAKDPKERFGSVSVFATALEQACQGAALHFAPTEVIMPSGPVAQPSAAMQPVVLRGSASTPMPNLPSTVVVPPSRAPVEPDLAAITSTPPGWEDGAQPPPATPATLPDKPRPSEPRTVAGVAAPPVKETEQPKRRGVRSIIIRVGVMVILLAILTGGIVALGHIPTSSYSLQASAQTATAASFHQEITTGPHIASIQVGAGEYPQLEGTVTSSMWVRSCPFNSPTLSMTQAARSRLCFCKIPPLSTGALLLSVNLISASLTLRPTEIMQL